MYDISRMPNVIDIGFTGEESFRKVEIDMSAWMALMPDGTPSIVHIRPGEGMEDAYIAETTFTDNILTWEITLNDLGSVEGVGSMQVWLEKTENTTLEKRGKSIVIATMIHGSISDPGDTIPPARTALLNLTAEAEGLPAGSDPTAELEHDGYYGDYNLKLGIPKGDKGDKGDQGDPAPADQVVPAVNAYLAQVITNPDSPPLDRTLSSSSAATPADITGDLKSAITFDEYLINDGKYQIKATDLESGQWSFSTKAANTARARTKNLLPVRAGMTITYSNTTFDTYFNVLETPTSQSYLTNIGWKTDGNGTIDITKDGYLVFIIRNHADTSATVNPSDYNSSVIIKTFLNKSVLLTKNPSINIPAGLTYFRVTDAGFNSSNPAKVSDVPINSYLIGIKGDVFDSSDAWFSELSSSEYYNVYCLANILYPNVRHYIVKSTISNVNYKGRSTNGGSSVDWVRDYTPIDSTLTTSNYASDSKTVGDNFFGGKTRTSNENVSPAFTSFLISLNYSSSNRATPLDIPVNSYCYTKGDRLATNGGWFTERTDNAYYYIFRFRESQLLGDACDFLVFVPYDSRTYRGSKANGTNTIIWSAVGIDTIKDVIDKAIDLRVLLIGNSYTNDCSAYTPFIMNNIAKRTRITIGTSYYSGASINDYVGFFDNNSTVLTYYKYTAGSAKWTSASNKTIKQIVSDEPWDIIIFQQASSSQGTWSTYANLNSLIDKIVGYYVSQHNKSVKLGWMFPELRYSVIETVTYEAVIDCVNKVLQTTPIQFFIPCGTAVQNARGTSLDELGDSGHLCADSNGHMQEGLPVLLTSYVTALKLLELCGENDVSVMGETIRPDQTWVTAISSPGQNGQSTGVTDANCLIAQKCAVAAIKFPETVSTIV